MTDLTITGGDVIKPIGYVQSPCLDTMDVPLGGVQAVIQVLPEYEPGLYKISDNSHLWILSWFGQATRSMLRVSPSKVNPALPERGVFAMRSAARPNPIALTLVELERIDGCRLFVRDYDAAEGTAVLDIKPYFEPDIIFSPRTPYLPPSDRRMRYKLLHKEALKHHGEGCLGLELAVKMAMVVEAEFGKLQAPELILSVEGDPCLADVLQGLTRARLANPVRFTYFYSTERKVVRWEKNGEGLAIFVRPEASLDAAIQGDAKDLFAVEKFGRNG